jgi:hypothetical protein
MGPLNSGMWSWKMKVISSPKKHIQLLLCFLTIYQIYISAGGYVNLRFPPSAKSQICIFASGYANLSNTKFAYPLEDMILWAFQRATSRPIREPQVPSPLPTTNSFTLILYHFEASATLLPSVCTFLHALSYIPLARFRYKLEFILPLPSASSTILKWRKEGPPIALPTELPPSPTELNFNSFVETFLLQFNSARLLHLGWF